VGSPTTSSLAFADHDVSRHLQPPIAVAHEDGDGLVPKRASLRGHGWAGAQASSKHPRPPTRRPCSGPQLAVASPSAPSTGGAAQEPCAPRVPASATRRLLRAAQGHQRPVDARTGGGRAATARECDGRMLPRRASVRDAVCVIESRGVPNFSWTNASACAWYCYWLPYVSVCTRECDRCA
jgi:hypothetical protein